MQSEVGSRRIALAPQTPLAVTEGLSAAQVSARCGVSLQQIQRYGTGANVMSVPMLWQLSRCLDVPIAYSVEDLG